MSFLNKIHHFNIKKKKMSYELDSEIDIFRVELKCYTETIHF